MSSKKVISILFLKTKNGRTDKIIIGCFSIGLFKYLCSPCFHQQQGKALLSIMNGCDWHRYKITLMFGRHRHHHWRLKRWQTSSLLGQMSTFFSILHLKLCKCRHFFREISFSKVLSHKNIINVDNSKPLTGVCHHHCPTP